MIYHAPSTAADGANASLRVQRSSTYTGGSGTVSALWVMDYTSPGSTFGEWATKSELHNQTPAENPNTGAVAVVGYGFKQTESGATYPSGQVGATWGANFACNDNTAVSSPTAACIGTEIDNDFNSGAGLDPNRQRVILQLAYGAGAGGAAPTSSDHIGVGILVGPNGSPIMDNFVYMNGTYGIGLNFANATFTTAPVFMGDGEKIVLDGTSSGTYNWSLSDIAQTVAFQYQGANAMTLSGSGVMNVTGSITDWGALTIGGNANLSAGKMVTFDYSGGSYNWALSDIAGTMAMQYGGANKFTIDLSGNFNVTGSIFSAGGLAANGSVTASSLLGSSGSALSINSASGQVLGIGSGSNPWVFDTSNYFRPITDNTVQIGASGQRVATGYFVNLGAAATPIAKVYATGIIGGGSAPTSSGTCPINTQAGGNAIGSFKLNGACASGTVILTFATTAPHDWACFATDATTIATTISQNNTTASTTTATLKFNATGATGDLIRFNCAAF